MLAADKLRSLTNEDIERMNWYYQIELKNGAYTNARVRGTSSVVREVVRHIDLKDSLVLDIGSQECLLPAMMVRQGAKKVVAYDRLNLTHRVDLVKAAYGVDFDYIHSLQLSDLSESLKKSGSFPFDVVVFAGVLYHMIDPLAGLAVARSLLREGGLMVIETSVIASNEYIAAVNVGGRLYSGSNYFQISLASLDYFLRMLRLKPIDIVNTAPSDKNISRVTIVARAVDDVVSETNDSWIGQPWIEKDMEAVGLFYSELKSNRPDVPYSQVNSSVRFLENTDIMDVCLTFENSEAFKIKALDGKLRLHDYS